MFFICFKNSFLYNSFPFLFSHLDLKWVQNTQLIIAFSAFLSQYWVATSLLLQQHLCGQALLTWVHDVVQEDDFFLLQYAIFNTNWSLYLDEVAFVQFINQPVNFSFNSTSIEVVHRLTPLNQSIFLN